MPDMTPVRSDDSSHVAAGNVTPTSIRTVANQNTPESAGKFKARLAFD